MAWEPSDPDADRERLVMYFWHAVLVHGIDPARGIIAVPLCKFCGTTLKPFKAECPSCGHPVWRTLLDEPAAQDRNKPPLHDDIPQSLWAPKPNREKP